MDRAWDTSKIDPKLSVSIFKVRRSGKRQIKKKMFGTRDTCSYVRFSPKTQKMILNYFLNILNRSKLEHREVAVISGNK